MTEQLGKRWSIIKEKKVNPKNAFLVVMYISRHLVLSHILVLHHRLIGQEGGSPYLNGFTLNLKPDILTSETFCTWQ